jgi:hypothetical protein
MFYFDAVGRSCPFNRGVPGLAAAGESGQPVEAAMKPLTRIFSCLGIAFASAAFSPGAAASEVVLSPRGCQTYASWSGNLVWARDLGASKDKAREELIVMDKKEPSSIYALMLRDLESLWATNADWEAVTLLVYQDCLKRRGRYGEST